jgi:ketosteroid isomerase-like protein
MGGLLRTADLGSPAYFLRWFGYFQPMTASALHSVVPSLAMKKSANAPTFAGRARAVGVTKYKPPSGRRQSAIDDLYTEDCVLHMPPGTFVGREALDKFAGDLRATHPQFAYAPHGEPQALHDAGRLAWGSGPRGEAPEYTGMDVIIVRDGKIAALYVFLDSLRS